MASFDDGVLGSQGFEGLSERLDRAALRTRLARRAGMHEISSWPAIDNWGQASAWVATQLEFHHANPKWAAEAAAHELDPGDIAALRFSCVSGMSVVATALIRRAHTTGGGLDAMREAALFVPAAFLIVAVMAEAVPFYVPAAVAPSLLGSHPPDPVLGERIRLPYPAVLAFFGSPLRLEPTSWFVHELMRRDLAEDARKVRSMRNAAMAETSIGSTGAQERPGFAEAVAEHGGWLYGAVLVATDDGRPDDVVLWLISAGQQETGDEEFATLPTPRTSPLLGPLADNIAAAVNWASWNDPPGHEEFTGTHTQAAKLARSGSFRRRAARGGAFGVRVLDLDSTTRRSGTGPSAEPGQSSRVAHLRRGHWRRARCGPRDDWHYEGRWIAPRIVSGDATAPSDPRERVYRLPEPPSEPPPEVLEAWEREMS